MKAVTELAVQHIRTTRELIYQELSGRYTTLEKGVPGFTLNENNINYLDATDKQKNECFEMLEKARIKDEILALVQGRVCGLRENDFYTCEAPKMYLIPAKII